MPLRTKYNGKSAFSNMYTSILPKTVTSNNPQSRNQINSNNWVKGNLTSPISAKRIYFYSKQPNVGTAYYTSGNCNGASNSPTCCESGYCCNAECSLSFFHCAYDCTSWCHSLSVGCPYPINQCPGT
jgi:hypothetical protein